MQVKASLDLMNPETPLLKRTNAVHPPSLIGEGSSSTGCRSPAVHYSRVLDHIYIYICVSLLLVQTHSFALPW